MSLAERLRARLLEELELDERPSRFGHALAFWSGRREVAHFEGPATLDLRLTRGEIRARRAALKEDPRVTLRGGDWLELRLADPDDVEWALELCRAAVAANG